nr:hypothetical protein MA16_Dca024339 [Tanacetum cinerariifolium]
NQQDFLDEYLPQWDDQLTTQKQRSESEWENPFAAKRGEYHTVLHISEEKDDDLPYPKFQKFEQLAAQIVKKHEEHAFPTAADDAESRKLYFPSTTEKLFAKLPPSLSKKIEESFKARHPGLSAGVLPAIKFTHTFVSEMCKDAALAKELRDLSLCSAIPIPGEESRSVSALFVERNDTLQKIAEGNLGRLLPHARGLGFKPRRESFPSGAKKEWGLSPKAKVRVLHTAQLDVTVSSNH